MSSITRQYSAAASRARNVVDKTADVWTQSTQTVTDRLSGLPRIDLVPTVERYFDLVQRTVDINHRLAIRWAEVAGTLSGVARERAESAGDTMQDEAEAAGNLARLRARQAEQAAREQEANAEQAEKERARRARQAEREQAEKAEQAAREQAANARQAEKAAREQAAKAGQAEKERAREAAEAKREHAKQAHKRARMRYEGLTKAQLSELLVQRKLPKTGNIDELIERLAEADGR